MRTRSGSLAAIMPLVPSHPACPSVACICAERANDTRSGCGRRLLNTADGTNALVSAVTASGNGAFGWFSLAQCFTGSFNTGVGAGTLVLNHADANTAVGTAALILNVNGTQNTACGTAAMVNTAGDDSGQGGQRETRSANRKDGRK